MVKRLKLTVPGVFKVEEHRGVISSIPGVWLSTLALSYLPEDALALDDILDGFVFPYVSVELVTIKLAV